MYCSFEHSIAYGLRLSYGRHAKCVPVCFASGLVVVSRLGTFLPAQLRTDVRSFACQSSMLTSRLIELTGKAIRTSRVIVTFYTTKLGRDRSPSGPFFHLLSIPN